MVGQLVGVYEIVRELGVGGFAIVYQAVRHEPFRQLVAIKFLRTDRIFDDEVVRRFEQERELLAGLRHRNICSLLDGGQTKDERPYFVMEYIEGQSIDRYCDARKLSIRERLCILMLIK